MSDLFIISSSLPGHRSRRSSSLQVVSLTSSSSTFCHLELTPNFLSFLCFIRADSARRNYDFANGYNAEDPLPYTRPPVRYSPASSSFSARPSPSQLTAAEIRQRREAQDARSRFVVAPLFLFTRHSNTASVDLKLICSSPSPLPFLYGQTYFNPTQLASRVSRNPPIPISTHTQARSILTQLLSCSFVLPSVVNSHSLRRGRQSSSRSPRQPRSRPSYVPLFLSLFSTQIQWN